MTSSPRPHRRRNSMDRPPTLSDVLSLKEELNRLHEDIFPQCMENINEMSRHVTEFEKDYRRATRAATGGAVLGGAALVAGGALALFTVGLSLYIGGLGAVALGAGIYAVIMGFQSKYKENNFRQTLKTELEEFHQQINPIIEKIEQIFNRIEEIQRDPTLSENQANAIRERFSRIFEKMQPDNRGAGDQTSTTSLFSGNLLETVAAISSVLDDLEEILESEVKESSDRPEEATTAKQIQEFKIKAEKFIGDMKKEINQLKNIMKEVERMKERISGDLERDRLTNLHF